MNRWKQSLERAGLDPKKELLLGLALILPFIGAFVLVYLTFGSSFYLVLPVIAYFFFLYLHLGRFRKILQKKEEKRTEEFVRLFTFFGVFIQDGFNVYSALKEIESFASEDMKGLIERLLHDVEEDKSVEPYIRFSSEFGDIAIKQVMISIYQMVDEGQGGVFIRQFERLFGRLSEQKHQSDKERWNEHLQTLSFLPLVGSGITMVALSLSLVNIMEGSLNVRYARLASIHGLPDGSLPHGRRPHLAQRDVSASGWHRDGRRPPDLDGWRPPGSDGRVREKPRRDFHGNHGRRPGDRRYLHLRGGTFLCAPHFEEIPD